MDSLPSDMVGLVFTFLDAAEVRLSVAKTCRSLAEASARLETRRCRAPHTSLGQLRVCGCQVFPAAWANLQQLPGASWCARLRALQIQGAHRLFLRSAVPWDAPVVRSFVQGTSHLRNAHVVALVAAGVPEAKVVAEVYAQGLAGGGLVWRRLGVRLIRGRGNSKSYQ
jgi:hypothetical protein